jgi:hypothetical protein
MPYELPYDEVPDELECPSCGRIRPASERFCESCRMPLVRPDEQHLSERQRRARKIDPQYTDGELVQVASAKNLAQAEFLAGLLLEEGIPSVIPPTATSPYSPTMGPRAVLVPESGAEAAREALRPGPAGRPRPRSP